MKTRTAFLLSVIGILLLIIGFPWTLFAYLCIGLFLIFVYRHYWVDKDYYGPYLRYGRNIGTEMVITWIAVSPKYHFSEEDVLIEYSRDSSFVNTEKQASRSLIKLRGRNYYHIHLENLTPDTTYHYRLFLHGEVFLHKNDMHFKTAPSETEKIQTSLVIYGDDQSQDWIPFLAQITLHAIKKENPDFIIHLGDINQHIWKPKENNTFFTSKRKLFRYTPYMPVIGNHDVKGINDEPYVFDYYRAFYSIPNWYAFPYGKDLLFIILSSEDTYKPKTNGQFEFIQEQLAYGRESKRFIIICTHAGPFNIEKRKIEQSRISEMRDIVVPLLEEGEEQEKKNIIVFSGHKHTYENIKINGIHYLTVGACSNAKYYSKLQKTENEYYSSENVIKEYGAQSFALLSLKEKTLRIEIKNFMNKTIDILEYNQ